MKRISIKIPGIKSWRSCSMLAALSLTFCAFAPFSVLAEDILLDRIVAVVEDDVITESEFRERVALFQERIQGSAPPEQLERQVLERMIVERLQLDRAEQLGIRVDDITLNEATRDIAAQNNLSLDELRDSLLRDGIDYVEFREGLRNDLVLERLRRRQLQARVRVSEQEIDDFLAARMDATSTGREYRLSHILIALPEAASPEQIAAARGEAEAVRQSLLEGADFAEVALRSSDGQNALDGGDFGWRQAERLPSIFARAARDMKVGDLSELIRNPSGFHIIRLSDVRGGAERLMVRQTRVRHILVTPNALVTDADAHAKVAELRGRIEAGDDFAVLAKEHSDDKASSSAGGDLGWANPKQFVPEFEDVMNSLREGELSEPFRSGFGWHIAQVLERREHDNTEVALRSQARGHIRERKSQEELELWLRRLRDVSYVEYRLAEHKQEE